MTATFEMETEELNMQFFKTLKALFGKRSIKISITDFSEMDTTEYLFSNPENAAFLESQINYVKNGGELVTVNLEKLRAEIQ